MTTKLYRSRTDQMIAGVCGGLGEYLGIDVALVRLFFVLLALGNGIGMWIYLLLWLIVPLEGRAERFASREAIRTNADEVARQARSMSEDLHGNIRPNPQAGLIVGVALIILGLIFLLQNLNIVWLQWLNFDLLWPTLLIIGGVALLLRHAQGE